MAKINIPPVKSAKKPKSASASSVFWILWTSSNVVSKSKVS